MIFLPIADRELRIAARRRFTFWSRVVAAAFMLLMFGMLVLILGMSSGSGISVGPVAFGFLKWLAFLFACSAGVFLTSDSISEEKREGTLGLLFLTDLRGHDVVFGKLVSQSLLAFYCVLAAFPILALSLLLGGVTGAEFWANMLIICNTLFLSLAGGMFVSSLSREVMKAMNAALLLNLLIIIGLPLVDAWLERHQTGRFTAIFSNASPGYLIVNEDTITRGEFWFALLLQHFLGWCFLLSACFCVPRAWQEKTVTAKGWRQRIAAWLRFGSARGRQVLRTKLLPKNPMLWIALRERWMSRLVWLSLILLLGALGLNYYLNNSIDDLSNLALMLRILFSVGIFLWVSTQACRNFVEAVRNGAMELILVTPVKPAQIVSAQWNALWRTFVIPVLLLVGLQLFTGLHSVLTIKISMPPKGPPPGFEIYALPLTWMIAGIMNVVSNLLALAWFGMLMGVTSRKVSVAALKSLVFVFVLPWLGEIFVLGITMTSGSGTSSLVAGVIVACIVNVFKNVVFIFFSREILLSNFRATVARNGQGAVPRHVPAPVARAMVSSSPSSP